MFAGDAQSVAAHVLNVRTSEQSDALPLTAEQVPDWRVATSPTSALKSRRFILNNHVDAAQAACQELENIASCGGQLLSSREVRALHDGRG
jgi:hypothetical protein